MATGWVKSLQCKSKAADDVVPHCRSKPRHNNYHAASCRKTVQSLREVVDPTRHSKPGNVEPKSVQPPPMQKERAVSRKSGPVLDRPPTTRIARCPSESGRVSRSAPEPYFPALTELPEGHPSRNVVEIIFQTGWYPKTFSGRVEMVFKVQHLSRSVTRFEEYREMVKSRADYGGEMDAREDHARCIADGNEVMRFLCLGSTNGCAYDASRGAWSLKEARIITFAGSGEAHDSAGGGRGRRAMLVCRVIAGRNGKELGFESVGKGRVGYDSVSRDNGELVVFDSRAVLPCFLIFYIL